MASCVEQATETTISLKGSTKMVTEFFYYAINSILYQRGIYPSESFDTITKYNLKIVDTCDDKLKAYLSNVLDTLEGWLKELNVQKLVLVLQDLESKENVERWAFDVTCDKSISANPDFTKPADLKHIQRGIQDVIRQVVSSITFLPILESPCSFDLLIYCDQEVSTPDGWDETTAKLVIDSEDLPLKSFTTSIHSVAPTVSYRRT
ncbi:hypothetical protein ACHWQZ_G005112 [Mnemiopsis leidyi]